MERILFILGILICLSSCENKNKNPEINYDTMEGKTVNRKPTIGNNIPTIDTSIHHHNNTNKVQEPPIPEQISHYIPNGFVVIEIAKGNLNSDKFEDVVMVLGKPNEDSLYSNEEPTLRKLILLLGTTDENFLYAGENDCLVYSYGFDANYKDAFTGITFKNGSFSIGHYGGFRPRWTRRTTFTYSPSENNWFLSEDAFGCFDTLSEIECEENILTPKDLGKIPFNKFNIYEDMEATRRYIIKSGDKQ